MKKLFVTMLALAGCLCMLGCGGGETSVNPTTPPTATTKPTEMQAPTNTPKPTQDSTGGEDVATEPTAVPMVTEAPTVSNIYDFEMKFDGKDYKFPMWASDLEANGWVCKEDTSAEITPEDSETLSWEKDGVIYYIDMYNFSSNTVPLKKCAVTGIRTDDFYFPAGFVPDITLPENIKFGAATKEEIIAAYGEPTDSYESSADYYVLYYDMDRNQYVHLTMKAGVLAGIEIRNRIALEGAATEVSYAIPDMVVNYKKPTVSGDVSNMIVTIDNVAYEVPCPVAELMENGFVLLDEYWDVVLSSGGSDRISFRYGNITIECEVANYAKYATAVQNCFVTKITAEEHSQQINLSVLGGITLGMSEAAVVALLDGVTYEKSQSAHSDFVGNIYTISNPEHATQKYLIMMNTEGNVASISITKYEKPGYGTGEPSNQTFDISAVPVIPEDSIYSFWMDKDGDVLKLPLWYSELENMGWACQEDTTVMVKPGEELTTMLWKKDNFTIFTVMYNPAEKEVPLPECQVIAILAGKTESVPLFTEYNGKFMLPGGIQLFVSSRDDILKAYGTPSHDFETDIYYHMVYSTGSGRTVNMYVSKEDGKLYKVEMSNKVVKK